MPALRTLLVAVLALTARDARADVDFARDVLPILSDNCFHCHGPDEGSRKAKLRLDTKEGAFAKKGVLVPGKSGASELHARVISADDDVMPPRDSNRKLTAKQKETLKKWIDEGAKWGQHWAYVPLPQRPPVPIAGPPAAGPIDRFIAARLAQAGLKPSPEAARETWLRRVTLDLTGLPPAPKELDAFLADRSPTAHEAVVDRLLASPRYGERMAADWLDLARFADTHGYQSDRFRAMWPYRDWVIRAFNANQPFDRFLTEQLAGDLLPNPTKDQRLATAFNRLHMQNEEGGVVEEEFRVAYVVDRVNTFGTTFLAQTFECCRCHDHKYDPLSQKDFYRLFAFFQNIDESGQTSYFTPAVPVPALLLSTDAQDQKIAALRAAVAAREADVQKARDSAREAFRTWARPKDRLPKPRAAYSFDDWKGGAVTNAADPKSPARAHESPKPIEGRVGTGAGLNGENGFEFPGVGHFKRSDPFSLALWVRPPEPTKRAVLLHHSRAPIDAGSRGYELLFEDGKPAFGLHHMWPGNSLKVRARAALAAHEWRHLVVTYDGSGRAAGVRLYVNGAPLPVEVVRDKLTKDIDYGGGEPNLAIGFRFRDSGFKGGAVDEFQVFDRAVTPLEAAALAGAKTEAGEGDLFELFLHTAHEPYRTALEGLRAARRAHADFVSPIPEAMVMQEEPAPKRAFVLKRGAYDAPGEEVTSGTPAALPGFAPDLPRNRLGLAQWLTHPDHPLTARVTVNRLWQQMFGQGLVETSDNFGTTGAPPTHPELLDWLARDFIAHGWDVKRALKQTALSATYRQSSRASAELLAKDPYNHLLARAPARRLTAEMLRDQALTASGLLVEKAGGPSVHPYQPDGLWNEAMGRPHYPRSKGADLYRRSLYTVWKRTAPHPQMVTFDAADRSVCTAKRQSTSTPLQALALLNDPQFVEAGRFLGQRMLKEGGGTTAERAAWTFRLVTGRRPGDKEVALLVALYDEQREHFTAHRDAAARLLAVGDSAPDTKLDPADLAAAAALGLALLNHDEAVNRR